MITPKLVIAILDTAESLIKIKDKKIYKRDKEIKVLKRKLRKLLKRHKNDTISSRDNSVGTN